MRLRWRHLAAAAMGTPLLAIAVAWTGVFDVGTSSGHWKATDWFLHFTMRSSVRTHAVAVAEAPPPDPSLLRPAAGHFARGCAICHGAPGEPRPPVALHMLPPPPDLSEVIGQWTDAQLFWIVKNGIRFTGMPAWPTQNREDEVWAMVAFLRELPSLDREGYRQLAEGETISEPESPRDPFVAAVTECARCHGRDGTRSNGLVPVIAGQKEAYLVASLKAYAEGNRASGMMNTAAAAVSAEEWPALARYFATEAAPSNTQLDQDSELVEAGRHVAEHGLPARRIPACLGCHEGGHRNAVFPRLDGQRAGYLEGQLHLFQAGKRGGTAFSHLMTTVAKGLSQEDMRAVSAYFSSRSPPVAP